MKGSACCGIPASVRSDCDVASVCLSGRFPSSKSKISSVSLSYPKPNQHQSSSRLLHGHGSVRAVAIHPGLRVRGGPNQLKPELGLVCILYVLSVAFGAVISVALISIPTIKAFRRAGDSVERLCNVVWEEQVPATLISLRLSGLEITQITQRLSTALTRLRQKMSSTDNTSSTSSGYELS